jgi:putative transposase
MSAPRCTEAEYISFLLVSPLVFSATEAARVQPAAPGAPAHDAFTRFLHREEPDPEALWREVGPFVRTDDGVLVVDDSVLDKFYARHMGLVGRFWSGKHKRVVQGIDLVTLLWADGDVLCPCDYRLVDPADGKEVTKNDHFQAMLAAAKRRGFAPRCVLFDSWYSGLKNLKAIRELGWKFLTQVRCNRHVNLDSQGNRPIQELPISAQGTIVHLKGFGLVKAFRIEATNGHTEYWITNDLGMGEMTRRELAEQAWGIEEYHRGIKQHTGAESCQARHPKAQRNHIGLAIRAFVRLEVHRFRTGVTWFEAKMGMIREGIRMLLSQPLSLFSDRPRVWGGVIQRRKPPREAETRRFWSQSSW